jgi:DNA-binding transcriptional regulator YiaG
MNRLQANPLIARALEIAEKKLGVRDLAWRLHASEATLRAWTSGEATMPQHRFLRLVDVLTELDPSWQDWDNTNG